MNNIGTLGRSIAIALLAISGAVAAFATIAPSPEAPPLPVTSSVETVRIPPEALLPSPQTYIRQETFQRGDTLGAFLARLGIADPYSARLSRIPALRALRPGMQVTANVSAEGKPLSISFLASQEKLVEIAPQDDGFRAREEHAALYTRIAMKSSIVDTSLFSATDDVGIPDSIAMQLADVFSGDIDFQRDLRKGDRFTVVYELNEMAGRPVRAGKLLAAEFVSRGKTYRAVQFGTGYYAPDGSSLRKAFLRSPLEFSRVTSGFGMRRNPISHLWRRHKGIDYGAPIGTRVRAVADGVVEFAGRRGGYGNAVILRHRGEYSTLYAHLSRIAVHRGARVSQNDTIGFVGQTGWATGPHLHYEFRVAGEARNPFTIAMPAATPLPKDDLPAFQAHAAPLIARLELMANSQLALAE